MAGSISLSLSQQFDSLGKPLSGGLMYFYQAGTVATPQNAYQDSGLTIAHPNPLTLDAAGRVPQLFFADGSIKVRLTDASGVVQINADNILVVGPSSGGGGGGTVDATTILATGDFKLTYGTGTLSGFVRANGRTIGSALSGASERANADCLALFQYLWAADPNLAVSTGRGASAAADWAANKSIAVPDFRGAYLAGLADMGNSATSILTSAYFGSDPTILGNAGGDQKSTLATTNLPPYTPSGTLSLASSGTVNRQGVYPGTNIPNVVAQGTNSSGIDQATLSVTTTGTFSGSAQGGAATPFSNVPPTRVITIYLKL